MTSILPIRDDGPPDPRSRPAASPGEARSGDVARFDRASRNEQRRESSGTGDRSPREDAANADEEEAPPALGGFAGLVGAAARNLAGGMPGMVAGAPLAASGAEAARCEQLVERILVSIPEAGGDAQVRIKMDANWLPGTEISMIRSPNGGLSVEFLSDNVDSQRFLLPNLSELRLRLSERTGDAVSVSMSESAGRDADSGDGRSRERRNLYDEREED